MLVDVVNLLVEPLLVNTVICGHPTTDPKVMSVQLHIHLHKKCSQTSCGGAHLGCRGASRGGYLSQACWMAFDVAASGRGTCTSTYTCVGKSSVTVQ